MTKLWQLALFDFSKNISLESSVALSLLEMLESVARAYVNLGRINNSIFRIGSYAQWVSDDKWCDMEAASAQDNNHVCIYLAIISFSVSWRNKRSENDTRIMIHRDKSVSLLRFFASRWPFHPYQPQRALLYTILYHLNCGDFIINNLFTAHLMAIQRAFGIFTRSIVLRNKLSKFQSNLVDAKMHRAVNAAFFNNNTKYFK